MAVNDLRLQVILQTIDRATAPLQRINGSSKNAAKALRDARERLKDLCAQQKAIGDFRELRSGLEATSAKLANAQAKAQRLAREFGLAGPPTQALTAQLAAARQVSRELGEQHQRETLRLQALRERLSAAGIGTRALAAHERRLRADIASTTQSIDTQTAALRAQAAQQRKSAAAAEALAKTQRAQARVAGAGVAMGATGAAIGAPVTIAVRDFASFEDHMLGVARQVQGARDAAGRLTPIYAAVRQHVRELAREIPLATNEIADMVVAGARMEVPTEHLKAYTRTAAMMATAFDAVPGELAEQMGKVGKNFKIPITQIEGLADSINYLDDNAISKGGEIIDVLNRISGVVSTVKMSAQDAAALSSTLLTLGERPEAAATAINAITQKLAAATKGTKKFQEAVAEIGLSSKDIQEGMATDATATFETVINAVRALPEKHRVGVMVELVGLEHSDTLAKLVDKPEELQRQRALANGDQAKGSMRREADARNQTLSAQWVMAKNRAFELTTTLGEALKPSLISLMDTIGGLASRLALFAAAHPGLTAAIMKAAAALSVLLVAGGAVTLAMASLIGPFAMARYGMAMLGLQSGTVIAALQRVGQVVVTLGRLLIAAPVGLVIAAIALAALLVIRYWSPIAAFFRGIWAGLVEGLAPLQATFGAVFGSLAPLLEPLRPVWDWLVQATSKIGDAVGALFEPFEATAAQLDSAAQSGRSFGQVLATLVTIVTAPVTALFRIVQAAIALVSALWVEARGAFAGGLQGIAALIANWSPVGLFYRAFAGVMRWFGAELPQRFTEFGANLLQGLVAGITSRLGQVRDAIRGAADGAIGWFKEKLGIRSPSRVFIEAGAEISNGAAAGIDERQGRVRRAALAMAAASLVALPAAAEPAPVRIPAPVFAAVDRAPVRSHEALARPPVEGQDLAPPARSDMAPAVTSQQPSPIAAAMPFRPDAPVRAKPEPAPELPRLAPILQVATIHPVVERLLHLERPVELPSRRPQATELSRLAPRLQHLERPIVDTAMPAVERLPRLERNAELPPRLPQATQLEKLPLVPEGGAIAAAQRLPETPRLKSARIEALTVEPVLRADPVVVPIDRRPPLTMAQPAAAPPRAGDQITINIHPSPGMDTQAIARAVAAELDRRDRAKRSARLSTLGDIN